MTSRELLLRAYGAYDAQDLDGLLALVSDDVDWPDDHGGRLHGRDALRGYWTEQWTRTHTHDEPVTFAVLEDGRVAVTIEQMVRSPDDSVLFAGTRTHLHRIEGGRIARLDIVGPRDG